MPLEHIEGVGEPFSDNTGVEVYYAILNRTRPHHSGAGPDARAVHPEDDGLVQRVRAGAHDGPPGAQRHPPSLKNM